MSRLRVLVWALTLVRVALIPVFLWLGLAAQDAARGGADVVGYRIAVLGILAAMALSDVADGRLARRHGLTSQAGAIVDAAADKVLQVTLAAFFVLVDGTAFAPLPLWFLGLLVGRDLVLACGWGVLRALGAPVRVVHRPHGRVASVLVFGVFFGLVGGLPAGWLPWYLLPTAFVVVASAVAYSRDGLRQRRTPTHT